MNGKTMKILGIGATIIGLAAGLLGDWIGEKKQEAKIAETVKNLLSGNNEA